MKSKLRRVIYACLSMTLCASLTAGTVLISHAQESVSSNNVSATESVRFEDVTRQVDTSKIVEENLNKTVMAAPKASYETRTVIVTLDGDGIISSKKRDQSVNEYINTAEGRARYTSIVKSQNAFLDKLETYGIPYKVEYNYRTVANALAITLNTSYVSKIKRLSGVQSAAIARTYSVPETYSSTTKSIYVQDNDTNVYATGIYDSSKYKEEAWGTGDGMLVAILDTGLDYTHDAFKTMPEHPSLTKDEVERVLGETTAFSIMSNANRTLTVDDVYINAKVPFAFDYADSDAEVYPSYSNHGTHVAGIVAGSDDSYNDKDGNVVKDQEGNNVPFVGVAPSAQLMICKVFTDDLESEDLGGSDTDELVAALEDCVNVGADVINMSLGTSAGFSTTDDGDDEGALLKSVMDSITEAGISLVCAASNEFSSGYGSDFGTNLATNPDSGTVGSPSTYYPALSVASISGQQSKYLIGNPDTENEIAVYYNESSDGNAVQYDFAKLLLPEDETSVEYEYVVIPGVGQPADYSTSIRSKLREGNRIALIKRGKTTFKEKVETAKAMGAIAIIVYNNVSGKIRMTLGDVENPLPAISIDMDTGMALVRNAVNSIGKIKIDTSLLAGPFMSDFSSWGTTPDLKIKPEITAHGGEITSTVPGGYDEQSGTSMASPNMAGLAALVRNYVRLNNEKFGISSQDDNKSITQISNQLIMSTATTVYDETGLAYSPRKQGSGQANLDSIVTTNALLYTDDTTGYWYVGKDKRPKVELGEDEERKGEYKFSFKVKNFGSTQLVFNLRSIFMTETLSSDKIAVAEKAYMLDDIPAVFEGNGVEDGVLTLSNGTETTVSVTLKLSQEEKDYIDESFKNGMFVEGFIQLESESGDQCSLTLPFMAFYGDWEDAPMLDYDAFDIAASEQDASVPDDEKIKPRVWATQAYTTYYNDRYVLPMGGYMYILPDDADEMYTNEEYSSVSRFNEYVSEDGIGNYMTSTGIKAVYAGLLRNARQVDYKLYNSYTGEVVKTDTVWRVSKAYSGGGAARPAYLELKISPEDLGLLANGKYTMDFEFFFHTRQDGEECPEENKFSFDFYVDYEAPVLQDARVRYYNYKEGNKDKQRIYLDFDVFDNHYPQSVMLCYSNSNSQTNQSEIVLATDYVTPVRNPVKNGVTTVSIEVTDIYERYKDCLYVQVDDYSLNHTTYYLGYLGQDIVAVDDSLNESVLPDTFELAEGEDEITVDVYGTHKVKLEYEGNADLSNFEWMDASSSYVAVKNGEIVGLKPTGGNPVTIAVGNRKGVIRYIKVNVTDTGKRLSLPSLSFGAIKNSTDALQKASGSVKVNPGETFELEIISDPWYYPLVLSDFTWTSDRPDVATVDQSGVVRTIKKGSAVIKATSKVSQLMTAVVSLVVQDPFTISDMTLTEFHGGDAADGEDDGVVTIPSDKNIMTIGSEAFKDNNQMTAVIIPKTVTQIDERAFINCTSLKAIYFIQKDPMEIADASLTLINRKAFYNCTSLETLDLSNVKVISVASEAFAGCTALKEIKKMTAIGTAYDSAFSGCSSLVGTMQSDGKPMLDLTGLHSSGNNVFENCTSLQRILTGGYTAIGARMFAGCTALKSLTLKSEIIGESAFSGCSSLVSVKFETDDVAADDFGFQIGNRAFADCNILSSVDFGTSIVKSIGDEAFANTSLATFKYPSGLTDFGTDVFKGTDVRTVTGDECAIVGNAVYNQTQSKLLLYFGNDSTFNIPSEVTQIGENAFSGSAITEITIPEGVTKIGDGAFKNSALESITFNCTALEEIGAEAFMGSRLGEITVPETVVKIGDRAFSGTPLTEFSFTPSTAASLGSGVFSYCVNLTNISLDDKITDIGMNTFAGSTRLLTVELPSTVTEIPDMTFSGCVRLTSVTGAEFTKVGAMAFNGCSALKTIDLSKVTSVDMLAFNRCSGLESVDLTALETVGMNAFAECTDMAVTGLENLVTVGRMAFYNCNGISSLNLLKAKQIDYGAFAVDNGGTSFSELNIPVAEDIGELAFFGGSETAVTIPETVKTIGDGAFAASVKLAAFTASGSAFTALDGVLYENLSDGTKVLVAYPGAKTSASSYTVADGTIKVQGYAFNGLSGGSLKKVELPYSVRVIGKGAFFNSGITEYTFRSIQAPVLEVEYDSQIDDIIEETENTYKGYYYNNFESQIVYFSEIFGDESTLVINCPENGKGYDNHIYSIYFGTKNSLGVLMDDDARSVLNAINEISQTDISGWASLEVNDGNKQMVEEYAERVINARRLLNNIVDDIQLDFIGEANIEKLTQIETQMRTIKQHFGIVVSVTSVTYDRDSYKRDYVAGEEFDPTGLKFYVQYSDYSVAEADMSQMQRLDNSPLTELTNYVRYQGYGKTVYVEVRVSAGRSANTESVITAKPETPSDNASGFVWIAVGITSAVVLAFGIAAGAIIVRRKTRGH